MAVDVATILPTLNEGEKKFALHLLSDENFFQEYGRARSVPTVLNHIKRMNYLKEKNALDTKPHLQSFLSTLRAEGKSTGLINHYIATARLWARYKKEKGLKYDPDILTYKNVKNVYKEKEVMSPEEVEAFISLPPRSWTYTHNMSGKTITQYANKKRHEMFTMFFEILFRTGMRTHEVARLEVGEVDFGLGIFNIPAHKVKTRKARRVPIPESLKEKLREYIKTLDTDYLFYAKKNEGKVLTDGYPVIDRGEWLYEFRSRTKRLGIKRANLTPYSTRHTYGTDMASNENVNLFDLKNLMGHSKITTTERYYHTSLERLKNAAAKHYSNLAYTNFVKVVFDVAMRLGMEKLTDKYGYEFTEDRFVLYRKPLSIPQPS